MTHFRVVLCVAGLALGVNVLLGCTTAQAVRSSSPSASASSAAANEQPPQIQLGGALLTATSTSVEISASDGEGEVRTVPLPFKHPIDAKIVEPAALDSTTTALIVGRECDQVSQPELESQVCAPGRIVAATVDLATGKVDVVPSPVAESDNGNQVSVSGVPGVRPVLQVVVAGGGPLDDRTSLVELTGMSWTTLADTQDLRRGWAAVAVEACSTRDAVLVKVLGSSQEYIDATSGVGVITEFPRRALEGLVVTDEGTSTIGASWGVSLDSELSRIGCSSDAAVVAGPATGGGVDVWASGDLIQPDTWSKVESIVGAPTPPTLTSNGQVVTVSVANQTPEVRVIKKAERAGIELGDVTSLINTAPGTATSAAAVPYQVPNLTPSPDSYLTFFGPEGVVGIPLRQIRFEAAR